jgi:type IV conjugative transfer system TraN protein involved in mating pair stabilization
MRALLLLLALAAGCASAPGPKQPDLSRRVPVNRTIPTEVQASVSGGREAPEAKQRHREGEVEWR